MQLLISYHVKEPRWKTRLKPYCKTIQTICDAAYGKKGELGVVLADDAFVKELNSQYRGKNKPTNVLSFAGEGESLGDIILAFETVEREAAEQGKSFRDHATHLLVHGVLHLLKYDHEEEEDAKKMEQKEIKILKKLGVKNPYA